MLNCYSCLYCTVLYCRLEFLNLSDNLIGGPLPASFGDLRRLKVCLLSNNRLVGPLPVSLGRLDKLKEFDLLANIPCETMSLPRAFRSHDFYRKYVLSTALKLDTVSWEGAACALCHFIVCLVCARLHGTVECNCTTTPAHVGWL